MPFEEPTVDVDQEAITERNLEGLADALPGWVPVEGDPLVALNGEFSRVTAATNALVVEGLSVAAAVGIGATLLNIPPREAAPAVIPDVALALQLDPAAGIPGGTPSTLDQSVSIPTGFQIIADTGSDQIPFELAGDFTDTITFTRETTGELTGYYTATVHIAMTATLEGTIGNVPADTPAEVVTSHPQVASASIDADAAGGTDAESLAAYLDRIVDYMSLIRPGGVRAEDLARLARTVNGVHRALGIDLYNPLDETTDNERTATVIAIDASGQPVTGSVATELAATLDAAREINFVIHLGDPTYTQIDVVVACTATPGADPAIVDADVTAAIATLLDPALWGSTEDDPEAWVERTQLTQFDVAGVVFDVDTVASVETITLNGGTTPVTLDGPGALPVPVTDPTAPSTVTVTVTPG